MTLLEAPQNISTVLTVILQRSGVPTHILHLGTLPHLPFCPRASPQMTLPMHLTTGIGLLFELRRARHTHLGRIAEVNISLMQQFQLASDGSLRPGYTTSNASSSARSSNTPPHHSHHPSPSISSSARTNAFIRESDEFSSRSLTSARCHRGSSSGSSNLLWGALTSSRPSPPVVASPDVVTRPGLIRGTNFGFFQRHPLVVLGDYIPQFYAAEEERRRATLNTIQGNDPSSLRSADRHKRLLHVLEQLSNARATQSALSRSVHEIIQGLHNARGLLERGVETARSSSGSPSRHEPPNPPPARYRLHSRLYASAMTVSSNSLVSESATEHRRTNARAHLCSQLFASRTNSDEPARDSSDISSLTAAARLRRLIASQTDSPSTTSSPPIAVWLNE
ncbi:hypothetical protein P692DRAFT_20880329 [Suillus brevipes Sb2]|nr:hypothetical protein P692DRAFT_20880329 [Suillus brevipes Sb2]